jgi:hypothetical protein
MRLRLMRGGGRRRTRRSQSAYGGDFGQRRRRERTARQAHALPVPVSWTRRVWLMIACMIASGASGPARRRPWSRGWSCRARGIWFYRTDTGVRTIELKVA